MLLYRLVKHKWRDQAFDGEGAKRYGGRWNSKGKACVYAAGSESLALLKVLVHLRDAGIAQQYVMFEMHVEDSMVLYADVPELPLNWRVEPAPLETAEYGDTWLASGQSLALGIPSIIVPREWNYLLNPHHPAFEAIAVTARQLDFDLDTRLA